MVPCMCPPYLLFLVRLRFFWWILKSANKSRHSSQFLVAFDIEVAVPIHFRWWWSPIVMERAQKHCITTITKTSTKTNYQTLMVWPVKIGHLCFFKLSVFPSSTHFKVTFQWLRNIKFSLHINSWLRHFSHTFYEGFNTHKTRTQVAKLVAFAAVSFEKKTFL